MFQSGPQIFIDIEASGFGSDSYPIEVGLALSDSSRYCRLIRPQADWVHWSSEAESAHKISRKLLLERGVSPLSIAQELNRLLKGKIIYSDGWVVDEPWLIKLFDAAQIKREFRMYDVLTILNEAALSAWHRVKEDVLQESGMIRHRASHDAWVVQQTYKRVMHQATSKIYSSM